jgi:hypothetical protein
MAYDSVSIRPVAMWNDCMTFLEESYFEVSYMAEARVGSWGTTASGVTTLTPDDLLAAWDLCQPGPGIGRLSGSSAPSYNALHEPSAERPPE